MLLLLVLELLVLTLLRPDLAGYCYINNAAVAVQMLRAQKGAQRVAVVDLDYHAGNGERL